MTLIMVAPNGARRTRQDHAQIPVTDDELVQTAKACFEAGASALHAHIRNADQTHLLNAARYQQLIHKMNQIVPDMRIQVTSEAAGIYASDQQIVLLETLEAPWVSLSIREVCREQSDDRLMSFFRALCACTRVQFIVYDLDDFSNLIELKRREMIPNIELEVLYVLGRYAQGQQSNPRDLEPFIEFREQLPPSDRPSHEMVCAFGISQIECLTHAAHAGLDLRIGFENGIWLPDGEIASDNASLVRALVDALAL